MTNREIVAALFEIADFLEADEVQFKPRAYRNAAQSIESLREELSTLYDRGGVAALDKIPGIGEHIAKKIVEFLTTGKLRFLEKLKKKLPVDIKNLSAIEGVGPKTIKILYKHLNIRTLADLERAAQAGAIRRVPGFHEKSEQKIINGIAFLKHEGGRMLLGDALALAQHMVGRLEKLSDVQEIVLAGSLRRKQETIGDIDLLAVSRRPKKVMSAFCSLPDVRHVYAQGPSKSLVRLKQGIDADLRIVQKASFGAALHYFTGSKAHSIAMRKMAVQQGMKLNEYGLFKGTKKIAGQTEEEIYRALGLSYIEPELRTDSGEIAAALAGKLPQLVDSHDIRGDLQVHTTWSDGKASPEAMVEAACKLQYAYIAFTDHTQSLRIAGGMDAQKLSRYVVALTTLQKKIRGITILAGAEVNILPDGSLDMDDDTLTQLDIVVAGVHSHLSMTKAAMTKRVLTALSHRRVNVLVHPTGRVLKRRPPYTIDLAAVAQAAARHTVALEVDAFQERLDLKDADVRHVLQYGVKLSIDTDAHHPSHLAYMELGVAQARRGWATQHDIINTLPLTSLRTFLAKKK